MSQSHKLNRLFVAIILIFAACVCEAGSLPGVSPEDAKNILPVSQVKRGMKGYGLTVFQGTRIEKFDVEVLGVLKKANNGRDLILVRIGGGPITSRKAGVIAGMSGSPCYINGKLIGAIAYGTGFAKEPIGMITPIADMLEAWDQNLPKQASGYSSPQSLPEPVSVGGKKVSRVSVEPSESKRDVLNDGVLYMRPLMTPLMVRGFSQHGIGKLAEILRPFHIQPTAGLSGQASSNIKADLVPGAAVGVSLASGDIDLTGVGTLTFRSGDRVVAFGHPMLGIGAIDAPMTTAYVDDLIAGYQESTKLASPIRTVGRIFQDRPFSIAGAVGKTAKTIPVTITVDDQAIKRARTFKVNVLNHPLLASRLITLIVGEAIFETHSTPGDATAEVSYDVLADQVGKITRNNVFFDQMSINETAVSDIGTLLQILNANRFYPLDIKSVAVKVRILDRRNTASVDRIFVKKSDYEPGETIDVGVVLRPYKKDRITRMFKIKVPATAGDGKVTLLVRGGGSSGIMSSPVGPPDEGGESMPGSIGPSMLSVDNVKQLVDKYLEREKNNQVVVQLLLGSTAINVAGEKLTGLPSAIADVMKSSRNSGLRIERDYVKEAFDDDMIVYGAARLMINIKKHDVNEKKSGPRMGPPMAEGENSEPGPPPGDEPSEPPDFETSIDEPMAADAPGNLTSPEPEKPSDQKQTPEEANESPGASDEEPTEEAPAEVRPPKPAGPGSTKEPKTKVKSVVRQVRTWSQKSQSDFAKGTFSGASASSENKLELVPTLRKLVETTEQFVWRLEPAKDGVYVGTGNSGKIYHVTDGGDMNVFNETGEMEVHSLARDSAGKLYAGTSPNGKVFRIAPDGKGELLFDAEESYILALVVDSEGCVYAGTGDAGKIYRIGPDGVGKVFATLNEQQILSLSWDSQGDLVAGTGTNGVVYRIDKYGKATPIFDAPESSITSVAGDSKGNVYAGTYPKGVVYKILPDGRSKTIFSKAKRVIAITSDPKDNIYAVSDGSVVMIQPDETVVPLDSSQDKAQFLCLAFNKETQALYAGTGNIGSIYISKCCDVAGKYESPVHDAKMISRWGRIKWVANTPKGTAVEVQTRTGNVATPDETWSDWSPPYTDSSGEQVLGGDARYVQYQVTLRTGSAGVSPEVSSVSISYLTPNQPPVAKLTAPTAGAVWSDKETIRWTGSDPDQDKLTYDVYYSKDSGKTWTALMGAISGANGAGKEPSEGQIVSKVTKELEKSPDVPEDMKKEVLKEPSTGPNPKSAPKPEGPPAEPSGKTSYAWDTKKLEDGIYLVKVVASDRVSNSTGALQDEVISDPFTICNSAPELTLYKSGVTASISTAATINGSAGSKLVEISGVQYRVDGGEWSAAQAKDGMFDSRYEAFEVTTSSLSLGDHKVEIQAVDTAGNASSGTVEVKVS